MSTDLIVLMGKGCGARQRVRQVAAWHTTRAARGPDERSEIHGFRNKVVVRHSPPLTRGMNVGPRLRQDESGPSQFGMIAVRKVSI
jgi:hypothetical protein